jgi:sugar/nucleoside kinase (ribokinase family)
VEKESFDVICIGQAVVDCITRGWDGEAGASAVPLAESITLNVGGDAFNEAVILSRLGHRTKLVCGLGDDLAGKMILGQAAENAVDISAVTVIQGQDTPVANMQVDRAGRRRSIGSRAERLELYSPQAEAVGNARIVSLASLFRAPLADAELVFRIADAAKRSGAILCADLKKPRDGLQGLESMRAALRKIDYIFPNEEEGAFFTGEHEPERMADAFLRYGVGNVIIKLGEKGCLVKNRAESFRIQPLPVSAIDTTGAGDNFAAGFLSALLHGGDLRACALFATAAAGLSIRSVGATSGVQSRRQVEQLLRQYT